MRTTRPTRIEKPWGHELVYAHSDRYAGKIITILAGHRLSLQTHRAKHETLYLLRGDVVLQVGSCSVAWFVGESVVIPPGVMHRIAAVSQSVILEVSTPELADVLRLQDDYGRATGDA